MRLAPLLLPMLVWSPAWSAPALWVEAAQSGGASAQAVPSVAPLVAKARQALLVIETPGPELPAGHPPMNPDDLKGQGSGVMIHPHGYAVTNEHVVECERTLRVRVGDDPTWHAATVVGVDAQADLALLKFDSHRTDWPHVPLGDDARLRVGDYTVALGHPFGLTFSASLGILSGRGRPPARGGAQQAAPYDYLQTDAAINPGNSGGPLLDLSGALVGLNTAVHARGQGIGFAIPAGAIRQVLPVLADRGRFEPGWLGIAIAERADQRVEVRGVQPGAAAEGRLQAGDVITAVDGEPVHSLRRLQILTRLAGGGATVQVKLERAGQGLEVPVVLGTAPRGPDRCAAQADPAEPTEPADHVFRWMMDLFHP